MQGWEIKVATQAGKKEKTVRPRMSLGQRDLNPEQVAEAYNKMMSKVPYACMPKYQGWA